MVDCVWDCGVGVGVIAGGTLGWCQIFRWERCSGCRLGDY